MIKKITILKDTREPTEIYNFDDFEDTVIIYRSMLNVGDYSIFGYENEIMLERKGLGDLVSSFIGDHRQNFQEMWERTEQSLRFLMIEGNPTEAFTGNYRSEFHPNSLLGSLLSWQIKYHFNWFFVDNAFSGQKAIFWLFKEFLRLKQNIKEAENESRINKN